MSSKQYALQLLSLFCGLIASLNATTNPLAPQTPVQVTHSGNIQTSVTVSGTSAGYMIACADTSNNLVSSFSSNGTTWPNSPNTTSVTNLYTNVWVSGTSAGFMTSFIDDTTMMGYDTGAPYGFFSTNHGTSWGTQTKIENITTVNNPPTVAGTSAGFMVTWLDNLGPTAEGAFSSNNGVSWTTFSINSGEMIVPGSALGIAGTSAGFLVTFQDTRRSAYSTLSTDHGTSWGSFVTITNSANLVSDVLVGGNASGFMAVWVDSFFNAYSSFTNTLATSWSTPVQIASNVLTGTNVYISGCSAGFVVAWIGNDHNAYASFSSDNGATWSAAVQINTVDGSVSGANTDFAAGFVSVSAVDSSSFDNSATVNCVFAWRSTGDDAWVSFSGSSSSGSAPQPPTNLTGTQLKNDFGFQFEWFNRLQWDASSSTGIDSYQIYRNGVQIATVDGATFKYEDHNRQKGVATTYSIVAVNTSGSGSSAASITVQ